MIITVTLNPALDRTAELIELMPGALNRLSNVIVDPAGKGVNVSKIIAALGGESVALGFAGGGVGEQIVISLEEAGIKTKFTRARGINRTNLKIIDKDARLTELNEPGLTVSPVNVGEFIKQYTDNLNAGDIVVLAGSLPQGVPMDIYAWLIRIAHDKQCLAYLDTDGEAFKAAMEEQPDFIKPNRHELLEYYGEDEKNADLSVLVNLCRRMNNRVERFVLSMGGDGAIFVNSGEIMYAPPIKVTVRSTVGAGDSMMGAIAFADARGYDWHKASALAMAASAGAVTTIGTKTPDKKIIENLSSQVVFERLQ